MRLRDRVAPIAAAIAVLGCACTDGTGTGESTGTIAGPAPDYVVTAVTDPPAQASGGTTFSNQVTVENVGTSAATVISTTRYFLSADPAVGGDRPFTATTVVPALAVGASNTRSVTLTVPSVEDGTYHVIACADRTAVIDELDNRNNCRASAGTMTVSSADLVVEALSEPPAILPPFTALDITATVRNAGTAPAAATKVAYFLSASPVRDATSLRLQPSRSIGALAAGAASTGTIVTFPPPLPFGSFHVLACADIEKRAVEADEHNNCTASNGKITVAAVDLAVTSLDEPPAAVTVGDVIGLRATTANLGTLAAGFSSTRFFLSQDAQAGDDLPVVGSLLVPSLDVGQTSDATTRIGIPDTTPAGSYFLLACADASGLVAETVEDNCRASTGVMTVGQVEAEPALVTVQLLGDEFFGPAGPDQPVLAHGPDGALAARTVTDAAGAAQILVPPGGSLTVVEQRVRQITTFHSVEDGDELLVGDLTTFDAIGASTLTVPPGPFDGNIYLVSGPCAFSDGFAETETVAMRLLGGPCLPWPRPLMAELFQAFSNELRGYIFDPEVDLVDGGATIIDGDWIPPFPFHLDVSGMSERFFPLPFVTVDRLVGTETFYTWGLGANGNTLEMIDGHAVGTLFQGIGGDGVVTQLRFTRQGLPYGVNMVLEYRPENATSLIDDVGADFVTMPAEASLIQGELEPGGPIDTVGMEWKMEDGAAVDGLVLRIARSVAEGFPPSWTVVMPPRPIGANQMLLPRLPPDLVAVWADGQASHWDVWAVDSVASSYAEFRREAEPQLPWQWARWKPTVPGKTRIAGTN